MPEVSLYRQVMNLFYTSEEAKKIYMTLKYCMQSGTGDELYIFENKKEAEEQFWKDVANTRGITYNTERLCINFYKEDYRVFYKEINQLKRELDGYRFKKIKFIEKQERGESQKRR